MDTTIKNRNDLQKLTERLSLQYFGQPFKHIAVFNNRLKTTGGRYKTLTHQIELNPKFVQYSDHAMVVGIIKHELCHYHLGVNGENPGHNNPKFKRMLKAVDAPRFVPALKVNQKPLHYYECKECGTPIWRRNRFNVNRYCCGSCRGQFKEISKAEFELAVLKKEMEAQKKNA